MVIADVYLKFPTTTECIIFLESIMWADQPICPHCLESRSSPCPKENRHHCNCCNLSFSVTVNTLFHRSRIPLQKWFLAIVLYTDTTRIMTGRQIASLLTINKNTGCDIMSRLNQAKLKSDELYLINSLLKRLAPEQLIPEISFKANQNESKRSI